jgi:hypothetical protein
MIIVTVTDEKVRPRGARHARLPIRLAVPLRPSASVGHMACA